MKLTISDIVHKLATALREWHEDDCCSQDVNKCSACNALYLYEHEFAPVDKAEMDAEAVVVGKMAEEHDLLLALLRACREWVHATDHATKMTTIYEAMDRLIEAVEACSGIETEGP